MGIVRLPPWSPSATELHGRGSSTIGAYVSLDLIKEKGVPLDRQVFTWRELAGPPFSKLDDDAFTRVRVILMNGIESEAVRFSHSCARSNRELRVPLARVRRVEQHQQK